MPRNERKDSKALSTAKPRKRGQTLVALALQANEWIKQEAQARDWRLVNLWHCDFILPEGMVPRGALVDALPSNIDVQMMLKKNIPVVRLGNYANEGDDMVPPVLLDERAQGRLAAEHFAERGFVDVCYFGSKPWSNQKYFFEAFKVRAKTLGMSCHLFQFEAEKAVDWKDTRTQKEAAFADWLKDLPKPIGLLAQGDVLAAKYIVWANRAGLDVPTDVAVLSRHNFNDACDYSIPTISHIDVNREMQARAGCELLERLMGGESNPGPTKIPPAGVIENESTSVLATSDHKVAAALRYMWDHLDINFSVDEVAAEVGLSRRQLSRRFKQSLGRSINKELQRKRLEELKRLLRTTDLPIAELGAMMGMPTVRYLHHSFLKAFGVTPGQYRREFRQTGE